MSSTARSRLWMPRLGFFSGVFAGGGLKKLAPPSRRQNRQLRTRALRTPSQVRAAPPPDVTAEAFRASSRTSFGCAPEPASSLHRPPVEEFSDSVRKTNQTALDAVDVRDEVRVLWVGILLEQSSHLLREDLRRSP